MIFKGTLRAREITLEYKQMQKQGLYGGFICTRVKGIHKVHYHQNLFLKWWFSLQNEHTTLTDTAYYTEMIMHLIPSFKKKENNITRKACICIQLVTIETKRENFKSNHERKEHERHHSNAEEVQAKEIFKAKSTG